MTDFLLNYLSPAGVFIQNLTDFSRLEYAGKENEVGVMSLTVPSELITPMLDGRLEIYRQVGAGGFNLEFDTQWFIRWWEKKRAGNVSSLTIKAYSACELMKRRITAYAADVVQTNKTGQVDNLMKAFIRENFGALAVDVTRSMATYLAVQGDSASGPIVTKAASWKYILPVIQELAETSYNLGTYLVFDVVKLTDAQLEFRTYIGQRGVNRGSTGAAPLVVSDLNGALSDVTLLYDYSDEGTYAYVGGKGESVDRTIAQAYDTTRLLATVINRREVFKDARNTEELAKVEDEADQLVKASRPKIVFNGTLQDTDGIIYGADYGYGDIVTAQYEDVVMDCHINTVHVTVEKGKEVVDIKLRGETYV